MAIDNYVSPTGKVGYRVRVGIGRGKNGKYRSKSHVVYGTYRQAQEVESQMMGASLRAKNCKAVADIYKMYREAIMDTKPIAIKKAYDKALEKPHCRTTSEKRIAFHRNYWKDFELWMREKNPLIRHLQDVNSTMAEDYIGFIRRNGLYCHARKKDKNKLSNDTLNEVHRTLQQVFELLKNETGLPENPFADIPKLKAQHAERQAYTEDQLATIFLKADQYLQPMFFIGLFTGLSEGDVCTLKKSEIHFQRHHIYRKRNKTLKTSNRESAIPMLPVLEDFLLHLVNDENNTTEYVLPQQASDYIAYPPGVSRKIKDFLEMDCLFETKQAIPGRTRLQSVLDFHSLRHTFCSLAGVVGIPLNVVQAIVGHMTPGMTSLYSRHVEEQERLKWIRLLGERINDIPGILPLADNINILPEPEIEPERALLAEKIKEMDMDQIQKILQSLE